MLSNKIICYSLLSLFLSQAQAAQLLENGDFEADNLIAWQDMSDAGAQVELVTNGDCFSTQDTRELNIRGRQAAMLRAGLSGNGNDGAIAMLRSEAFVAGDGFAFVALTEAQHQQPSITGSDPVFQVEILNASNNSRLISQIFIPNSIALHPGCPGENSPARPVAFSSHYFSTSAYTGKSIKIQFSLMTPRTGDFKPFTLIDQVVLFQQGEQAVFYSRPHAQAGISLTSSGTPYLNSAGSFDPDLQPAALSYNWTLNERLYTSPRPCLVDLDHGNYHAVLYVNDGHHAISDDIHLYVGATNGTAQAVDLECYMAQPSIVNNPVRVTFSEQTPASASKNLERETGTSTAMVYSTSSVVDSTLVPPATDLSNPGSSDSGNKPDTLLKVIPKQAPGTMHAVPPPSTTAPQLMPDFSPDSFVTDIPLPRP